MRTTDTLVIGAGQAGLAMSRCLADRGVDHVVLERGRVAERWRSERWDSLRLLSPNWMSRLPGWSYTGPDPHGFMTAARGRRPTSPTTPTASQRAGRGGQRRPPPRARPRRLRGDDHRPDVARRSRRHGHGLVRPARRAGDRRRARRRHHPGRAVALPQPRRAARRWRARRRRVGHRRAAGRRAGRGRAARRAGRRAATAGCPAATAAWTSSGGSSASAAWTGRIDEMADPVTARREPSLQLVGRPDHGDLDLATLQAAGVELAGRLVGGRRVRRALRP